MHRQFFVPHLAERVCVTAWVPPECKDTLVVCPPACTRTMAGIRYFTTILCKQLAANGHGVVTFDYLGTGDSSKDIREISYADMVASAEAAYDMLTTLTGKRDHTVVGAGFGNFVAPDLSVRKNARQLLLLNPDPEALAYMAASVREGRCADQPAIEQGYLSTPYSRMNATGSDASHVLLNFDDPPMDLRFWEAVFGPFYGGEEEAISCRVVQEAATQSLAETLAGYRGKWAVLYWGPWFESSPMYQMAAAEERFDCGRLTNAGYWLESSRVFDNAVRVAAGWVDRHAPAGPPTIANLDRGEMIDTEWFPSPTTFVRTHAFRVGAQQMLGVLHGPRETPSSPRPLVVFEHGLGCDRVGEFRAWNRTARALAENGFYAFRYDHRGSGASAGAFEETMYPDYVVDLKAALASLKGIPGVNTDQVIIVSWSSGARISWLLAREDASITGMVMWSPVINEVMATTKIRLFRNEAGHFVFPISPLWLSKEFLLYERSQNLHALYDACNLPALVITGELDDPKMFDYILERVKTRPYNRHVQIKDAGHCFSQDVIEEVVDATVTWIREFSTGGVRA